MAERHLIVIGNLLQKYHEELLKFRGKDTNCLYVSTYLDYISEWLKDLRLSDDPEDMAMHQILCEQALQICNSVKQIAVK